MIFLYFSICINIPKFLEARITWLDDESHIQVNILEFLEARITWLDDESHIQVNILEFLEARIAWLGDESHICTGKHPKVPGGQDYMA